jgi:hypothetical protein
MCFADQRSSETIKMTRQAMCTANRDCWICDRQRGDNVGVGLLHNGHGCDQLEARLLCERNPELNGAL